MVALSAPTANWKRAWQQGQVRMMKAARLLPAAISVWPVTCHCRLLLSMSFRRHGRLLSGVRIVSTLATAGAAQRCSARPAQADAALGATAAPDTRAGAAASIFPGGSLGDALAHAPWAPIGHMIKPKMAPPHVCCTIFSTLSNSTSVGQGSAQTASQILQVSVQR